MKSRKKKSRRNYKSRKKGIDPINKGSCFCCQYSNNKMYCQKYKKSKKKRSLQPRGRIEISFVRKRHTKSRKSKSRENRSRKRR